MAKAEEAQSEARRSKHTAWFWWANLPVFLPAYWLLSQEPWPEKVMLCYLAAVSIIALAVTYESKAKGSEAKAASYEAS